MSQRILVVDDDAQIREFLLYFFEQNKFENMQVAANGFEARNLIESQDFDAVVTDIRMPQYSGVDLAKFINEKYAENISRPVVIGISAFSDVTPATSSGSGFDAFFVKPFKSDALINAVKHFCEARTKLSKLESEVTSDKIKSNLGEIETELKNLSAEFVAGINEGVTHMVERVSCLQGLIGHFLKNEKVKEIALTQLRDMKKFAFKISQSVEGILDAEATRSDEFVYQPLTIVLHGVADVIKQNTNPEKLDVRFTPLDSNICIKTATKSLTKALSDIVIREMVDLEYLTKALVKIRVEYKSGLVKVEFNVFKSHDVVNGEASHTEDLQTLDSEAMTVIKKHGGALSRIQNGNVTQLILTLPAWLIQ